jgi:exopolysaccharide production protein ExoZ
MRQKFLTIQYLRGIAAILVLVSHALLYPLVEENVVSARLGWLGVVLFFVISGFIMVAVTGEGSFSARDFLRRRLIRIVPLYWAATLLAGGLALFAPHIFKSTVFDWGQLIQSMLFVPFFNAGSGGIHPIYKLGWTLNYEMFFYVCFALLAFLGALQRVVWLTVAFAALAVLGWLATPQSAIGEFYTNFMPLAFCAGAWLGLLTLRGQVAKVSGALVAAVAMLGLLGLAEGFGVNLDGIAHDGLAFVGFALFATALVLLAIRLEPQLPRIPVLELLGDASYSIYLAHIYVVAVISHIVYTVVDPHDMLANDAVAVICILGGTGAGVLLYLLIEKPLLRQINGVFGRRRPEREPVLQKA